MLLTIANIKGEGETQPRIALSEPIAAQMTADLRAGVSLPPVEVFQDGLWFWLVDGFHRLEAHRRLGRDKIEARVSGKGDARAAFLRALELNAGTPLALIDRKAAAERMLRDPEWSTQSDRWIGRKCGINHKTVGVMRQKLSGEFPQMQEPPVIERKNEMTRHENEGADVIPLRPENGSETGSEPETKRKVTRGGKTFEVNTANIGKHGRENKGKPKHLSTKAWSMMKDTPAAKDENQRRQLGRLAHKLQMAVARRIADGEARTVKEAVDAITKGAPVDDWGRAYEAVMKLPADDRQRLCHMVLADLQEAKVQP